MSGLRIIGGTFRGRRLAAPRGLATRRSRTACSSRSSTGSGSGSTACTSSTAAPAPAPSRSSPQPRRSAGRRKGVGALGGDVDISSTIRLLPSRPAPPLPHPKVPLRSPIYEPTKRRSGKFSPWEVGRGVWGRAPAASGRTSAGAARRWPVRPVCRGRVGWQAEVTENLPQDVRCLDRDDDGHAAAALRAFQHVQVEHTPHQVAHFQSRRFSRGGNFSALP